jgi:hypothetical protein
MSNMRTDSLHVHLPVCIFHGRVIRHSKIQGRNISICGHDHVLVRICGVHQWYLLGALERQNRPKEGAPRGPVWYRSEHATSRVCQDVTDGIDRTGSRRFAERVRSSCDTAFALVLTDSGTLACSKLQSLSWSQTRSTSVSSATRSVLSKSNCTQRALIRSCRLCGVSGE